MRVRLDLWDQMVMGGGIIDVSACGGHRAANLARWEILNDVDV
jgi:hypothetical protein